MPEADITKGFGGSGWSTMMTIWEQAGIVANNGEELTPETFKAQMAATSDNHIFGSVPLRCADAAAPYTAVCNSRSSLTRVERRDLEPVIAVVLRHRPRRRHGAEARTVTGPRPRDEGRGRLRPRPSARPTSTDEFDAGRNPT